MVVSAAAALSPPVVASSIVDMVAAGTLVVEVVVVPLARRLVEVAAAFAGANESTRLMAFCHQSNVLDSLPNANETQNVLPLPHRTRLMYANEQN